jgi:hypothetical protein
MEYSSDMTNACDHSGRPRGLRHEPSSRLNTGIVDSNPNRDMYVCVRLSCVCVALCVASGLATG